MKDIEIYISESFDNPREVDYEELENWKTEDYIDYGCTLEKNYEVIEEKGKNGEHKWMRLKGQIGLCQYYRFNVIEFQSWFHKKRYSNSKKIHSHP